MARKCRCELKQGNEFAALDRGREIVGNDKIIAYAERHRMLLKCDDCFGVIADFSRGGRGYLGDLRQLRPNVSDGGTSRTRRFRPREMVIRGLNGGEVDYRFFGASYELKQKHGVDLEKLDGFKGKGGELAREIRMNPTQLAAIMRVEAAEFLKTEYDLSKK